MRRRSFAARVIGLGLFMFAPASLQAQTSRPDLSTLMRTQILDIWLSRTPDGSRILIDPPGPVVVHLQGINARRGRRVTRTRSTLSRWCGSGP